MAELVQGVGCVAPLRVHPVELPDMGAVEDSGVQDGQGCLDLLEDEGLIPLGLPGILLHRV
jgi:hypothetical protein